MISGVMIIEHFYKNKNYGTFLLKVFIDLDATLKITVYEPKGDMKLTFKDDGDKIKANIIGVDLVFEKQ